MERLSPEPDQLAGGSAAVYARVFSILFRSIADSRFASDVIGLEYERRRDSAHVVVAPVDTLRSLNFREDAERVSSGDEALLDWDVVLTLLESLGVSLTVRSVGVQEPNLLPNDAARADITCSRETGERVHFGCR